MITEADLAAAWESGYWHGTSHEGPLNDAAVSAKNPYKKKSGPDTPAKKSVQTANETAKNTEIPVNKTIKYPATVREAGDMAEKLGMKLSEFLEMLGPIPMPPTGYTLAKGSSERWTGPETMNRGWIITPAWNGATNTHYVELWMADHQAPAYAMLAPDEALQLTADLTAAARALPGGKN